MSIDFHIYVFTLDRPMGWDNENKIAILDEHIKSFDSSESFESQITKPYLRKVPL